MDPMPRPGFWRRVAPACTLVMLAPMIAEVLPGATRLSAIFVLPVEMGFWGCGALLIRGAVRRWQLGWRNMLLLAFALALAEELLVQQTSLAPLVIQIVKGPPYARAFGVNWIYLLWALGYESVLVVFLPVALTELIFPARRDSSWLSKAGLAVAVLCFAVASFFAWFSWTQFARVKIFHLPPYTPPREALAIGAAVIVALVAAALGPARHLLARPSQPLPPPSPWAIGVIGVVIAILWYGLVLLAFGIRPDFPVTIATAMGVMIALLGLLLFPRWSADRGWNHTYRFATVAGVMLGSMGVGFVGFIGASPFDLYGKAVLNAVAVVLLIVLASRLKRSISA